MAEEQNKNKRRLKKLLNRYRLVVMNDDTLEERFSLSLTPLRVFVVAGTGAILIIFFTTTLISLTPLREYIPGYGDAGIRREMLELSQRADSLENATKNNDKFMQNMRNIISGKGSANVDSTVAKSKPIDYNSLTFTPSAEDASLRAEVEKNDKSSYVPFGEGATTTLSGVYFYSPVSGVATSRFNAAIRHFGIDIAAPANDPVKSVLDGTIISADWTIESGNTIQVLHSNNMVSVYKHNSSLLKKEGETVKAGEAIALVGSSGENSTGPHLHFELWHNGNPVNPADYINF
ncbi:MAG: M23 family metallopeptidase [Sphingobacteriales bacterium JAD_PAG50586_3]|nr:MAG: M23 family metallopeptidase [Sphingobacteriales bacterium JAD_PAG50586_3]